KQVQLLLLGPHLGAVFDGSSGQPVPVAYAAYAFAEGILIGAAQVDTVLERLPVTGGKVGKFAVQERQEDLLGRTRQVERPAAEGHGAVIARGACHAVQRAVGIGDAGYDGVRVDAHAYARRAQLLDRLHAEFGARGPRFQQSSEFLVQRGDGDMYAEHVAAGDFAQQIQVTDNQVALGDQSQVPAALPREDFQDGARPLEAALGRLVGVRGGSDGDAFVLVLYAGQLLPQQVAGGALGVNLVFELRGVQFHELVSVAREAVFAADFAAPVRVDGPTERHVRLGAVQDAPRRNFEILHAALGFEQFALSRELGDPHEGHGLSSPFGKRNFKGRDLNILVTAG